MLSIELALALLMPAITSGTVLVTGANGYIAQWIIERLLKNGFRVRGTVRSERKAARLRFLFAPYADKLDVIVVKDITKDTAFNDAVRDVDAIIHTASPVGSVDDPNDLIIPAVRGTVNVLRSARARGVGVKRVVVLSSLLTMLSASVTPLSEADWNDESLEAVQTLGRAALQTHKYSASKVLSERAAWDFVGKYGGELGWDLVVLNPALVYGAPFDVEEIGMTSSLQYWVNSVFFTRDKTTLNTAGVAWVDVHQLADVHVHVLQKPEAASQRVIVAAESYVWQEWINAARKIDSSVPPGDVTFVEGKAPHPVRILADKSNRILGMRWISKEECIRDLLPYFKMKGIWGAPQPRL